MGRAEAEHSSDPRSHRKTRGRTGAGRWFENPQRLAELFTNLSPATLALISEQFRLRRLEITDTDEEANRIDLVASILTAVYHDKIEGDEHRRFVPSPPQSSV